MTIPASYTAHGHYRPGIVARIALCSAVRCHTVPDLILYDEHAQLLIQNPLGVRAIYRQIAEQNLHIIAGSNGLLLLLILRTIQRCDLVLSCFGNVPRQEHKKHRLESESVLCILPVAYPPLVFSSSKQILSR